MQKHLFKWFSGGSAASLALLASPLTAITSPVYASDFLEEVVVTARKREESVQDTPIAISAFTGEGLELRGVDDLSGLDNFSPNLVLRQSPNNSGVTNAAIYIRGIGQNDFTPVSDPGVGVYVDGVYLGRSVGAVLDLVDVERVEVLRGPQGTLFGKNTIGGAVSLTSKQPGEEFGGKISVKVGTDDRKDVTASFDLPISDTLLTRLTLASFQQDGYVTRVGDGKDLGDDNTKAARFSAVWLASDTLKVSFAGDYSKDNENGPALITTGFEPINSGFVAGGAPSQVLWQNTVNAQIASNPGGFGTGPFFGGGPYPFPFNFDACFQPANLNNPACFNQRYIQPEGSDKNFGTDPTSSELESWGISGTVEWEVNDNLTFKSITSYRTFDGYFSNDNDGAPQRVSLLIDIFEQDQFSQEFQLLGNAFDDRLKWILGLYYFEEDGKSINPVRFSEVEIQSGGFFDSDSWAVFGQGTYDITDKLSLTLGLRYTEDTKKYLPDQFFEAFPSAPILPLSLFLPPCPGTGATCQVGDRVLPYEEKETSSEEVTPMINIAYQWNDGLMTYVTYSEGFKGGGFTQRIFPPEASLPSFEPEFVTSYELGFKYDGWDNRLRVNGAVFHTDYEDQQLGVADPSRVGPFTTNAGDAEIRGVELEVSIVPADGWFISASMGYLDPERIKVEGNVVGLTESSRFENISDWNANVQVIKEIDLAEMGTLSPRIEWSYRSEYGTNTNNVPYDGPSPIIAQAGLDIGIPSPAQFQESYDVVNASLKWEAADSGLSVTFMVENIGDEEYKEFGNQQDAFGFTTEIFNRGRQYYMTATYEF